ncbi:MAG: argininosuccinate lyase [Deltaproteobacteria bacterium]|nr:argininosuccinate lyase [Deltaproteobacteria bacterium]
MSSLLWQKSGVELDERIQAFLASDDVILDRELFLFDVRASITHVQGLARIGALTTDESTALVAELEALGEDFSRGAFQLDDRYEDGHSAIEARLTERLADVGRKVHTGRSRNDQVLVAIRLWLRARTLELHGACVRIASVCLARARTDDFPMPGYTHLQRAMVSSTRMWWAAYAEAFIDDARRATETGRWIDANPLGTAAGYGVNLPLDRDFSTSDLGFERLQLSPIYAQLSRGKFELAALEALGSATLDLRRLAWDLSIFTMSELGFVALPQKYVTGSSLMPNKRNPDVVELLRATHPVVASSKFEIEQALSLPSGYHRDLQLTKGALIRGMNRGLTALNLLSDLLGQLSWVPERMAAAIEPSMFATDLAIELSRQGLPFREAYRVAADPDRWEDRAAEGSLSARVSPGGHAELRLEELARRLEAVTGSIPG